MEAAYNQMKGQVDELTVKLDASNNKIAQLESNYESVVHERDDYKQHVSLSERKVSEIRMMLQKDETTNSDLEAKVAALKSQIWKLEGQVGKDPGGLPTFRGGEARRKISVEPLKPRSDMP